MISAEVAAVIGNPCLMVTHRCSSLGVQYTCMYNEPALYCLNVCDEGFCVGGECHAEHVPDNNGYDGKAKCRLVFCPNKYVIMAKYQICLNFHLKSSKNVQMGKTKERKQGDVVSSL